MDEKLPRMCFGYARRYTANRFICALMWWYWESHASQPKCRVIRVYSFHEYFTASGHHLFVEHYHFWQQLYRAVGMVFPWLKGVWDRLERRIWPPEKNPDWCGGM